MDLGIFNSWTAKMRAALGRLNSELYPPLEEIGFKLRVKGPSPLPPLIDGLRRTKQGAAETHFVTPPAVEKSDKKSDAKKEAKPDTDATKADKQDEDKGDKSKDEKSKDEKSKDKKKSKDEEGQGTPMKRLALPFALSFLLLACGGSTKKAAAPTLPPANPHALNTMEQGVQAAKQPGGQQKAIGLFSSAVKTDPHLWEARYNLGVLLAEKGELAHAEKQLAEAAKLAPNAEDVVVALAEVRRRRGDPSGAAEVLDKFVKAHPKAIAARISLVSALRDSNKLDDAIKQAREVLVRRPSDPDALAELALTHVARGEMDTAELLSEESLKGDQKSAVAERTAGLIALKRGNDAIAFKHFETASRARPEGHHRAHEHRHGAAPGGRLRPGGKGVPRGARHQARRHLRYARPGGGAARAGQARQQGALSRGREAPRGHPEARARQPGRQLQPGRALRRLSATAREGEAALQALPLGRARQPPGAGQGKEEAGGDQVATRRSAARSSCPRPPTLPRALWRR